MSGMCNQIHSPKGKRTKTGTHEQSDLESKTKAAQSWGNNNNNNF